jgi:hypothetical protein
MIDMLASIGVQEIDLNLLDDSSKHAKYERFSTEALRRWIARVLGWAARHQRSVIVRPISRDNALIQLDDLSADMLERLKPVAFLGVETSPGNFQAWIALPTTERDPDLRSQLCRRTGADPGASGAVHIAGSINFKQKYAPNFPRVRLAHSAPGRITSRAELESLGVVAPPEPVPVAISVPPITDLDSMLVTFDAGVKRRKPGAWPDYQRCLDGAPRKSDGTADRSRADYFWCRLAIQWGWSVEETAERLEELSEKAQGRYDDYAIMTARRAAEAVEHRQVKR